MTTNTPDPKERGTLERHVQTILIAAIIGMMVGGYNKVSNISDNLLIIREQAISNKGIIDDHTNRVKRLENNDSKQELKIDNISLRLENLKEEMEKYHTR